MVLRQRVLLAVLVAVLVLTLVPGSAPAPAPVPTGTVTVDTDIEMIGIGQVSGGGHLSCAVRLDGAVACWAKLGTLHPPR